MKMTALQSQVYYPLDVNAERRTSNNQLSTQQHQMCCFETEMVSDNIGANGVGTTTTTGQTEEAFCTFSQRHLMRFEHMPHRQRAFDGRNNTNPPTVEKNLAELADSIRSELDTIPYYDSLNIDEGDVRNFETSAKEALDDFKDGLLNLVQDQMELISLAYNELLTAISGNINNGDNNSIAEIPEIENDDDGAAPATTDPQPFNFDALEMKLREKFTALLDELLKELKETTYVQNNFLTKGNGEAYRSFSGNYEQMMASTISSDHGSERETFKTLA
jgi:hypothetical protein